VGKDQGGVSGFWVFVSFFLRDYLFSGVHFLALGESGLSLCRSCKSGGHRSFYLTFIGGKAGVISSSWRWAKAACLYVVHVSVGYFNVRCDVWRQQEVQWLTLHTK
jgi:hypothetical protein